MMGLGKTMIRTLLVLGLLAPAVLSAQTMIYDEGRILQIDRSMINLSDAAYKLSSTTKIRLLNNKPGQIGDLKVGDYARVSIVQVGKKRTVETIQLIKNLQSNESMLPEKNR